MIIFLPFCSPSLQTDISPENELGDVRIEEMNALKFEADTLFARGNISCLKEAFQIYQKLYEEFQIQDGIYLEKQLKAALLLDLKEKEIGILSGEYLKRAEDLVDSHPSLSEQKQLFASRAHLFGEQPKSHLWLIVLKSSSVPAYLVVSVQK